MKHTFRLVEIAIRLQMLLEERSKHMKNAAAAPGINHAPRWRDDPAADLSDLVYIRKSGPRL